MHRKLSGYFLLSFLSFCFFTVIFLAIANVQASAAQLSPQKQANQQISQPIPTPTIYIYEGANQITNTPTVTKSTPTPTPAKKKEQSSVLVAATQRVTPEPTKEEPTETPVPPTATPIPTDTPIPSPTVTAAPTQETQPSSSDLDALFNQYSSTYNVSADELRKIARCESGFNTNASAAGLYEGMFQFSASTWSAVRGRMGLDPNPDLRTNPAEAIKTAAYMLAQGEQSAWPNCH